MMCLSGKDCCKLTLQVHSFWSLGSLGSRQSGSKSQVSTFPKIHQQLAAGPYWSDPLVKSSHGFATLPGD